MRSTLLIIIIISTSPLVLFAQSDTSLDFLTKSEPKDEAKLSKPLEKMGSSEAGLFYSTWGTGLQGSYSYTNEILLGGSFASGNSSTESEGLGTSIKSESTFMTVNGFGRYYLRDLGITDGLFGQAGLAFRNWTGKGSIIEDRTQAKIASIKIDWSPVVIVTGIGWHKVWGYGLSFSVAMNASLGGKRTIEYTENMHKLSDSMKKDFEKKTDFPTNLVIYIGYSF